MTNYYKYLQVMINQDQWTHIWGNGVFSTAKNYKRMIGHTQVHLSTRWLWKSCCQMKHKVFFWLILHDRLNTRGILKRRNMVLDNYNCEMCIWQQEETTYHLLLRCNFAQACWLSAGLPTPRISNAELVVQSLKRQLPFTLFMEIIILMSWSIWTTRNE